jgi:hypothetical protein
VSDRRSAIATADPAAPEVPARGRGALLVVVGCGIVLAAIGSPAAFVPLSALGPGLDPSYVWAIGRLPELPDVAPGRDWVFPFGPLGHLLIPPAEGPTLYVSAALRVAGHLGLVGLLLAVGRQRPARLVAATLGWLFAVVLGLQLEAGVVLGLAFAWCAPGPRRLERSCLVAALVPVAAFTRTSLALAGGALLAAGLGVRMLAQRRSPGVAPDERWSVCAPLLAAIVAAGVTSGFLFPSPGALARWASGQLELALGFGQAMSLAGEPSLLAAAVAGLAGWLVLAGLAARRRWGTCAWWSITAIPVALSFRHAFARADDHVLGFFPLLVGGTALGLLLARDARETACVVVALLLAAAGGLYGLDVRGHRLAPGDVAWRGLDGWLALARPAQRAAGYRQLDREWLAPERLPDELVGPLRAPGVETDVVPFALSLIAANDLAWRPSPTLQLYTAYTAALDRRVATHYLSPSAPDALLVHFGQVDGRNPVWDTPVTWRAVLAAYRHEAVAPDRPLILLRRRERPLRWSFEEVGVVALGVGQWLDVPPTPPGFDFLFAELEAVPTFRGRMQAFLLRSAPLHADVAWDAVRRRRYRLVPGTAAGGILLAPLPRGPGAIERIARGQFSPRAERVRVVAVDGGRSWAGVRLRLVAGRLLEGGPDAALPYPE